MVRKLLSLTSVLIICCSMNVSAQVQQAVPKIVQVGEEFVGWILGSTISKTAPVVTTGMAAGMQATVSAISSRVYDPSYHPSLTPEGNTSFAEINELSLSDKEQFALRKYRMAKYGSQYWNEYVHNNLPAKLTKDEIALITSARKDAALLSRYNSLRPYNNIPAVKSPSVEERVVKMFRDKGIKTKLGVWHDRIDAAAPGKTLYLEKITEKNASAAWIHNLVIAAYKSQIAGKYEAPVNVFYVYESYLHMLYIDGEKQLSSYVHVGNSQIGEYVAAFARLSDNKAINFVIGDNRKIMRMVDGTFSDLGLDSYHRRSDMKTGISLSEKVNRLHRLKERSLNIATTTIVNGLPANEAIAWKQGFTQNDISDIEQLKGWVHQWFEPAGNKINSKDAFFRELQTGSNDIMLVFVHADGDAIYINDEKVTLEALEQLQARNIASTEPRIIIMTGCETGNIHATKGFIFKKDIKAMAQVLVEKGFADYVIAPDDEIVNEHIEPFFQAVLSGVKLGELNSLGKWKFKKVGIHFQGKVVNATLYFAGLSKVKDSTHS